MTQQRLMPPPANRVDTQSESGRFLAQIAPTLHAARQALSPAQRGALNRGIVRHNRRGASVEETIAFIRAFAADPAKYAKNYPDPPPLDPKNHQLKPPSPDDPMVQYRQLRKLQDEAFQDRMRRQEQEAAEAADRYFQERQVEEERRRKREERRRGAPRVPGFRARY